MRAVAIIGSRDFPSQGRVSTCVDSLPLGTVVITGGWWDDRYKTVRATRGVDRWAALAAKERGLTVVLVGADYEKHKRSAGFRRNPVTIGLADHVVAFWDNKSNGTRNSIEHAKKLGKSIEIITP